MSPPASQKKLEVLLHSPQHKTTLTPLLFVHGAFTSAWCWEERYLPFFAAAGFEARAVSLSGHGGSRSHEHLDSLSINDYADDIAEAVATMSIAPVLIGHSMGGFVVQKYLEQHTAPAAVLMCSVPPQGFMTATLDMMLSRPSLLIELNRIMSGTHDALPALRDALFAQPITLDDMKRVYRHAQPESHRAIWDMTLLNLPQPSRVTRTPLLVLGAALDQLIPASAVEMTARTYGVEAEIFPAMGHGMMLERDWQQPAQRILAWLGELGLTGTQGEQP